MSRPFKLGLIVNPYAGIGGAMALKGSDGAEIRNQALAMGAEKLAGHKAELALKQLKTAAKPFCIYTAAGEMGGDLCQQLALPHEVVYRAADRQTEGFDTQTAAAALRDCGVDLLVFAGGDGTARNVFSAVGEQQAVLGIPAGVKIHSGVFAVTPAAAGRVMLSMIAGEVVSAHRAEVMDIDEQAFRQGKVKAKTYGQMLVPSQLQYIQAVKMGGRESDELVLADIAAHIAQLMQDEPQYHYVMGSGSTVAAVMQELDLENTLLGVDWVFEEQLLGQDMTRQQLQTALLDKPTRLVITLIGGQGHIFGRGNQQLGPELIRHVGKHNLLLVASKRKLQALNGRPLLADTGDASLDAELCGPIQVITGYQDQVLYPVADPGGDNV